MDVAPQNSWFSYAGEMGTTQKNVSLGSCFGWFCSVYAKLWFYAKREYLNPLGMFCALCLGLVLSYSFPLVWSLIEVESRAGNSEL